jgi:glycosyltransferase involved in cell wall biosynthesis
MANKVDLSVIIPTYNRAHLLMRTIQGILDQTYEDFELIIVDDCSIDNTKEVVRGFNDKRIKFIQCERNRGAAAARNIGILASKRKYMLSKIAMTNGFRGNLKSK